MARKLNIHPEFLFPTVFEGKKKKNVAEGYFFFMEEFRLMHAERIKEL